jgi:hypothetical protein
MAVLLLLAACSGPLDSRPADAAGPEPVRITARAVTLDPRDPERTRIGKLVFRGGVSLTGNDGRFGGWSDLDISEDGTRLTAISDRGFWLDAKVEYDAQGAVAQLYEARLGDLLNLGGRRQPGLAGDAEGMSRAPDGSFFVGYERRHRIWLYPAAEPPFSRSPRVVPPPPDVRRIPENGGMEAIVRLPGGRLFVLTEEFTDRTGDTVGWIGDGRTWQKLTYVPGQDFKPTGAARLPDGDVLVLERRFTRLGVPGARIVRLKAEDIQPGARLAGSELALIEPPLALDNFEGIAARRGSEGQTLIYILSDDNYFFLQRTLLLSFELAPGR